MWYVYVYKMTNGFSFNQKSIGIAVTTYYPTWYEGKVKDIGDIDKIRGDLSLKFIAKANDSGMEIVVIDGKSSLAFRKKLSELKSVHTFLHKGVKRSPARRKAIEKLATSSHIRCIIVTEPEKLSLLSADCLINIVKPILVNNADVVIPRRDPKLFKKTYPGFQYRSERSGNSKIHRMLKRYGIYSGHKVFDFFFGPSVFKNDSRMVSLYQNIFSLKMRKKTLLNEYLDPEEFSDTLFFPPILGLAKGYRVRSATIPFTYPAIQRQNEEIGAKKIFLEKRRSQQLGVLIQIRHLSLFLLHDRASKLVPKNP